MVVRYDNPGEPRPETIQEKCQSSKQLIDVDLAQEVLVGIDTEIQRTVSENHVWLVIIARACGARNVNPITLFCQRKKSTTRYTNIILVITGRSRFGSIGAIPLRVRD